MVDYTIEEFCDVHDACEAGREWALENCGTMKDVWDTANPDWLIWVATRQGVLTDGDLRLFACWCVRQVWHLLDDERSKRAVEVAERYAVGEASDKELARARAATRAATRAAARAAAKDAAKDAAWVAAWVAARAAARAAAKDDQAKYLREHCNPNFEKQKGM